MPGTTTIIITATHNAKIIFLLIFRVNHPVISVFYQYNTIILDI
ncbi:MAG: hypothetical protein ACP6IS_08610 [Candidatus Asgardarchaeia archaeon]